MSGIRKIIGFVLAASLGLSATTNAGAAAPIAVYVDGQKLAFSVDPVIVKGNTLVPFRPVFEALGLKVEWSQKQKKITGTDANTHIQLVIGLEIAVVNGDFAELDAAPVIVNGNTLVPLQFVGEATGSRVSWNGGKRTITIERPASAGNTGAAQQAARDLGSEDELKAAIRGNDMVQLRALLQAEPASPDRIAEALEAAIQAKSSESVRQLLAVKSKYSDSSDSQTEKRLLHLAIDADQAEIVQALLDYQDAASFAANQLGMDCLQYADQNGRTHLMGLFLTYMRTHQPPATALGEQTPENLKAGLTRNFPYVVTNLGIIPVTYIIEANTLAQLPYDYDIKVRYDDIYLYRTDFDVAKMDTLGLLDNDRFSEAEKNQYVEDLRTFTRTYADFAIRQMPGKKLNGQFFLYELHSPYWLPANLRGLPAAYDLYDSRLESFLTWANYDPTGVRADYANSSVTTFHYYTSGSGSKDLNTDVPLQQIKIGRVPTSISVGDQLQIQLQFVPENASDIEVYYEVKPQHQSIVRVDGNGLLTALQPGYAEVWVRAKNNEFIFNVTLISVQE